MALTYFELLPQEILDYCIFPRLGDLSKVILRCAYRGHKLPPLPLLYRDAADSDSLLLVQYLIDNTVPFCHYNDVTAMYYNIAAVRSHGVAELLVNTFRDAFRTYYKTRYTELIDELKDGYLSNRHLFAPYVSQVMDIMGYLNYSNSSQFADPIVRIISLAQPQYIAYYGNYFAALAIKSNDEEWVRYLDSNGYLFNFGHLYQALTDGALSVVPIIRQQLGVTDDSFNKICLKQNLYKHVTDITPLMTDDNKIGLFIKAAERGATNVMEQLASRIDLVNNVMPDLAYPLVSLRWFYDHGITVTPYAAICYETDNVTAVLLSQIAKHHEMLSEYWTVFVNTSRLDLLTVLFESRCSVPSTLSCRVFNEAIFELLWSVGVRQFDIDTTGGDCFAYLQWAYKKGLTPNKQSIKLYSLTERIWLIEHNHRYNKNTFMMNTESDTIDDIVVFVSWMKKYTYKVAGVIFVRGFEKNYGTKH